MVTEKSLADIEHEGGVHYLGSDRIDEGYTEGLQQFRGYVHGASDVIISPGDVNFTAHYVGRGFIAHLWPDKPLDEIKTSNGRTVNVKGNGVCLANLLIVHMLPKGDETPAGITASFKRT